MDENGTETQRQRASAAETAGEGWMFLPLPVAASAAVMPATAALDRHASPLPERARSWWSRTALRWASPAFLSRVFGAGALRLAWSTELDRGLAFILAPAFLTVGAISYYSMAREPGIAPLLLPALLAALLFAATASRPVAGLVFGAAALCFAGAALAKLETMRAGTKMLGAEVTTTITGRVARIEHMASGRARLTIEVMSTARPLLRHAPERVRVSTRKLPHPVMAGSVVSGLVRLLPPAGPVRPGSYDFAFESYFDGIGASGFFLRGPEIVDEADQTPDFDASVQRLRHAIAERIRSRIGGPEGEIAAALVVGVRAGIPEDVNEAMRRAGIYHIISISGLHMALVAGSIMGLLRCGFALFPRFSCRHPVKKYTAALAIGGLGAYLFISGGEVAAQRSFLMLAIMLTAVLFDRAALTLRNLALSAVVVIIASPHEVVGPSFQMSFAATAALVGAYAMWSDYRERHPKRQRPSRSIPGWLASRAFAAMAGIAVTSLVAGGATAIYSAWHFQQLSSLGLLTNLATMPIVSVVMLLAVLGTAAMPIGAEGIFLDWMGIGLSATIAIARWFAERTPLDLVGPIPATAVAVVTMSILVATVTTTRLRMAALPLAVVGLAIIATRPSPPDLLIAEDARLLGLDVGDGRMAVTRPRPNAFTAAAWQRTLAAGIVLAPDLSSDGIAAFQAASAAVPGGEAGFSCSDKLCIGMHETGATVAHAADAETATKACDAASVIVVDDATAAHPCPSGGALVVTARDLARRGAAAVSFVPQQRKATAAPVRIEFAIEQPYRPWHEHRRFSRAARGLPEYSGSRRQEVRSPSVNVSGERQGSARSPSSVVGSRKAFNSGE